jgi:uncharacterized lipoprotein YajG
MLPRGFSFGICTVLVVAGLFVAAGCTTTGPVQTVSPDITRAELTSVPVNDITIAYEEIGYGEIIVLAK